MPATCAAVISYVTTSSSFGGRHNNQHTTTYTKESVGGVSVSVMLMDDGCMFVCMYVNQNQSMILINQSMQSIDLSTKVEKKSTKVERS